MNRRILFIFLGLIAFFATLGVGAAGGAALTYLALNGGPARALAAPQITFQVGTAREAGILIAGVTDDSPAARAGLARGDILLEVDGQAVDNPADLHRALQGKQAGEEVELKVLHGDEERTLTATLDEQGDLGSLGAETCGLPFGEKVFIETQGFQGVTVTQVVEDGPATQAGLKEGDRILAVDGVEIGPENSLPDLIASHEPGQSVTLQVESQGEEARDVTVTLGEHPEQEGKAYLGVQFVPGPRLFMPGKILPEGFPPLEQGPFEKGVLELPDLPEGVEQAALVGEVAPGSPAEEAGLKEKDLITAIDGQPLETAGSLAEAVQAHQPGDKVQLSVFHPGETEVRTVEATLSEDPDQAGRAYLGIRVVGFIHIKTDGEGKPPADIDINLEFLNQFKEKFFNELKDRLPQSEEI